MRLGVLDVGSNTVHLLVVDGYRGACPMPAFSHKAELRLSAHLEDGSALSAAGEGSLRREVEEALRIAEDKGVEEIIAFATSAVRDAVNGEQVLARIRKQTGAQIDVMTGHEEARLTFLAARRWFGWSSGRLLVIDIGGGSLEVASGIDEEPDAMASLPLGAGRLTRDWIGTDPPAPQDARRMRKHVRAEIARQTGGMLRHGPPDQVVGTSKTFRQLARIAGAVPSGEGLYVTRVLRHADVAALAERLPKMTQAERLKLPGVSASRVARCRPEPSSPTPLWNCWASRRSNSARGRCARASSCGAWICSRRAWTCYPGWEPTCRRGARCGRLQPARRGRYWSTHRA